MTAERLIASAVIILYVAATSSAFRFQPTRRRFNRSLLPSIYTTTSNVRFQSSGLTVRDSIPPAFRQSVKANLSTDNLGSSRQENGRPNPRNRIAQAVKKMISAQSRFVSRFRRLSKRAQRIVIAQMIILSLFCGTVAKSAFTTSSPPPPIEIAYSSFLDLVEQQSLSNSKTTGSESTALSAPTLDQVRVGNDRIVYRLSRQQLTEHGETYLKIIGKSPKASQLAKLQSRPYLTAYTRKIPATIELQNLFRAHDIPFTAAAPPRSSALIMALRSFMVAFYCLILFRLYQSISGASGAGNKDAPGKLASSDLPMASFEEIQGIDDAKLEVMELVDTLRNPEKYAILGARAPTGLLLEGPPGTGKTMLARATAASAGVPLLYCSGSDFVEMFVGRGAARVRKLFERAARLSPCIIFVDELDALGKSRDAGGGIGPFSRSNDEAEQTLNQLLACMDGLDSSRRICVLAATNRKDVLDSALIRPGRFDRIVKLKLPDTNGRENILRVHCTKLPGFQEGSGVDSNRTGSLGKGRRVDLAAISVMTEGFSGAELEFLVNEAAIRAVRRVSSALAQNQHANDIVPHVEAEDFEASLANFYETRKSKKGVWNNVFK